MEQSISCGDNKARSPDTFLGHVHNLRFLESPARAEYVLLFFQNSGSKLIDPNWFVYMDLIGLAYLGQLFTLSWDSAPTDWLV